MLEFLFYSNVDNRIIVKLQVLRTEIYSFDPFPNRWMSVCEVLSRHSLNLEKRTSLGCQSIVELEREWARRMEKRVRLSELCVTRRDESFDLEWQVKEKNQKTFWFFAGSHPFFSTIASSFVIRILFPSFLILLPSHRISSVLVSLVKNRQMSTFPLEWIDENSFHSRFSSIWSFLTVFHFGILFPSPAPFTSFLLFSWFICKMVRAWYDAICTCVIYGLCLFRDPFQLLLFPSLLCSFLSPGFDHHYEDEENDHQQ